MIALDPCTEQGTAFLMLVAFVLGGIVGAIVVAWLAVARQDARWLDNPDPDQLGARRAFKTHQRRPPPGPKAV